jgi:hypothetical protein
MNPIIICLTATAGPSVHVRAAGSLALLVLLGASTRLAAGACLHVRAAGSLALLVLRGAGTRLATRTSNFAA